jgi:hypothetical protein
VTWECSPEAKTTIISTKGIGEGTAEEAAGAGAGVVALLM